MDLANTFRIVMDMSNAAFVDDDHGEELADILRGLADRIDGRSVVSGQTWTLKDHNGNTVGQAEAE